MRIIRVIRVIKVIRVIRIIRVIVNRQILAMLDTVINKVVLFGGY